MDVNSDVQEITNLLFPEENRARTLHGAHVSVCRVCSRHKSLWCNAGSHPSPALHNRTESVPGSPHKFTLEGVCPLRLLVLSDNLACTIRERCVCGLSRV